MSRNGSGTFIPVSGSWNPAVGGTTISSTDWAALLSDLASGLTTSIAVDGQTPLTASIPFAQGLTSSMPVGIGMTPVNVLDITQTQNNTSIVKILNASAGTAAQAYFQVSNGTAIGYLYINGTGFTPAGVDLVNGTVLKGGGSGGLTLVASAAQPIYFATTNTEVARFDAAGSLLVGLTASPSGVVHAMKTGISGNYVLRLDHSHATAPQGQQVFYSGGAPNDTSHLFIDCIDTGADRMQVRSNGGIANFSANNVNLASDARIKSEVVPHTKEELDALEGAFKAVDWGKFKYEAQTHDDWNYGLTTQGLAAAFAEAVPTITEIINPEAPEEDQRIGYYTEDVNNIAHALLARALERIAILEAKLGI